MKMKPADLVREMRGGNVRALGRVLSLIEDGGEDSQTCLEALFPFTGRAYVIGVTGAPGAGKSTLVDQLAQQAIIKGNRVGILAIDPSSPFTGGALLGDRIRMSSASVSNQVFIRSMASRGALGGIANRTPEAIFALDAAGFDTVIVETVGVGQAEVEIVKTADTVVVVLVPGMGDSVQAMKAGILEIADVFAINKSDYEGADRLERELVSMLSLGDEQARKIEIIKTIASEGKGVSELLDAIQRHRAWAKNTGAESLRRTEFLQLSFERAVGEISREIILKKARLTENFGKLFSQVCERKLDPISAARSLVQDAMSEGKPSESNCS